MHRVSRHSQPPLLNVLDHVLGSGHERKEQECREDKGESHPASRWFARIPPRRRRTSTRAARSRSNQAPGSSGKSNATAAPTTTGTIRPMQAIAEPIARFRLVCTSLACAARSAAPVSGSSRIIAIRMPTNGDGCVESRRPLVQYPHDNTFASPTTPTVESSSKMKLCHAAARAGWSSMNRIVCGDSDGRK